MAWVLFEDQKKMSLAQVVQEFPNQYAVICDIEVEGLSTKLNKQIKKNAVCCYETSAWSLELLKQIQTCIADIEIDLLWEFAPELLNSSADIDALALTYFGGKAPCSSAQRVALWWVLWNHPVYFRKKSQTSFEKADAQTLEKAKLALIRKQEELQRMNGVTQQLLSGVLPDEIKAAMPGVLLKPDKNSWIYKALMQACEQTKQAPERLLWQLGAIDDVYQWHLSRFLNQYFPKFSQYHGFGKLFSAKDLPSERLNALDKLPMAGQGAEFKSVVKQVGAFSIDDQYTTEIDDAFSVYWLANDVIRIGIHIAAPAFAIERGDELDQVARERSSTVYMPGDKITLLPEAVIAQFSLDENTVKPCVSLYVDVAPDMTVLRRFSCVERVAIAHNLRLHELEQWINEAFLDSQEEVSNGDEVQIMYSKAFKVLWRFANAYAKEREQVRGKPEVFHRIEFNVFVDHQQTPPMIDITRRLRGAPIDKIVSELMIFANVSWGGLVADHHIPMIYRSQRSGRVEMGIYPHPHESMGVKQYAWCTSPLRRYVDLVNQRQLICVIEQESLAPLKAPYKPKDVDLYAIIASFDANYRAYHDHQNRLERFWSLYWLKQNQTETVCALVRREDELQLLCAPVVVKKSVPKSLIGQEVSLRVIAIDTFDLSIELELINSKEIDQAVSKADEMLMMSGAKEL